MKGGGQTKILCDLCWALSGAAERVIRQPLPERMVFLLLGLHAATEVCDAAKKQTYH
jgi:hypothetical protein